MSTHLFRHLAGWQMQEVAGDLKQTQGFLGHSSIGITSDVYVNLQPDSEVESMKKLEETCFRVCKDGFRATTADRTAFEKLAARLEVTPRITEVDGSSLVMPESPGHVLLLNFPRVE